VHSYRPKTTAPPRPAGSFRVWIPIWAPLGRRRLSVRTFSVEGIHQSAAGHLFWEGQPPQIGIGESSTCSELEGQDFWARGLRSYWALQLYEQTGCPHGGT